MIQRIQSLFILISIALMAIFSSSAIADIVTSEQMMTFFTQGVKTTESTILETLPMLILVLATIALDAIAFISFKKRILQIRLITFSMILKLGTYGLGAFYILQFKTDAGFAFIPKFTLSFPIVAFILSLIAIRAIGKDEALVKSLERIR